MRSKRTQEPSSIGTGEFVPNGRETRDKTTLLPGARAFDANRDLFLVRSDDVRPTSSPRLAEDIAEHKHAERGVKIISATVLAGLAALGALLVLGALELVLERALSDPVALSVPVIFGSITAAGITYFALRRQEAFHRRTLVERERAENARREAERKYRDIFENAVEGIFQTSPDGGFITANPALARMMGFASPEELIRARDIDGTYYVHPERRVEFKRLLDQHDTVRGFEFEAYRKDGTKIWMSDNVRAVRDASGKLLYYEGTTEDITERKRAEDARREAERKYRDIFENAVEGIFQTTPDGEFITANPALARMLGFESPEELIRERTDIGRTHYVESERRVQFMRLLDQHDRVQGFESECYRKDGTKIWMSDNVRAVRDASGKLLYYEGTAEDITERKLAEEALRESEERYRDLVENSRELICTHDLDGLILSANPAAAAAAGYDLDEFVGKKTIHDLLATEVSDQFDQYMARLRKEGTTSGTMLVRTRSGERRVWEYYNSLRTEGVATPIVRGMARDITEQRRAERAMSDLRRELELTMNSMGEGVHRVDPQGNIAFENPAAARMLGWEVAELLGKPAHLTMHHTRHDGSNYPREECPIYATLRDGVSRHVTDEVFWRQDGTSFPVEYKTAPIRNDRNEIVAAVVTFSDITERRRAEESLQLFRNLIDQSNDAIEVIDPITLRFIDCNESAYRSLGYSREEFLALTVFDIDPVVDRSMIARFDEKMKESGFATLESLHLRKDGTTFPVEVNVKIVRMEREYRLAVVRDITRRKQAEEALRDSEERYRELFENDKDAIYVHDLNGIYRSVNRAAERLSGYSREEILGKHFRDFVSPEYLEQVGETFGKKVGETGETNYEIEIICRDGARVPVEVSSRLIYENGVAVGVQGSARDITERKRAQEALLTYSRRLLEAQEAERGRIARELHDQIGQMLTALKLNLHAIQFARNEGEASLLIEGNLKMLDEALEQVRNLSVDLRPLLLDDLGLVTALRWFVDHQAKLTNVRAEFTSDSLDPDLRFASELETACFRIAQEALTNVARHARAKTVTVRLSRNRDYLILLVEDDGVGFDINALQGHALANATLGLRGMQERAHAVGGRVKIDSATDKGTQLFVELPIAMPDGRRPRFRGSRIIRT
jgi:PAS domain S-box-containing protein